jgi:hypothetical protein
MRSRAEVRSLLENALRAASIVLLGLLVWLSLDRGRDEDLESTRSATLDAALARWSASAVAPARIAVRLDSTPSPRSRDWLSALRGAGSAVSWHGELPATAVSVQPVRSPRGGFQVLAAAPERAATVVSDEVGPLDTASAAGGGAAFAVPSATGSIAVSVPGATAIARIPSAATVKRVLVLGSAGWESKFVVAALEEDGWIVDAVMHVAPGISVTQGASAPLDTSRYSAVVALDGAAASRAPDIARYVASGGGLVIAGNAASIQAFAALRAGTPGRLEAPQALSTSAGTTSLRSLAFIPIAGLEPDAIALERRASSTAIAARRHGAGRVVQQGYLDTWRWRMSGGDNSVSEHRDWWTRTVAAAAYAGSTPRAGDAGVTSPAPLASLVAALGPAAPAPDAGIMSRAGGVPLWLLATVLAACLLGEWASRRLRGLR